MAVTITGPEPLRQHTAYKVPALLDLDAPLRAGISRTTSGDFGLTGETATVEKLVWAALLTEQGALDWDPTFGTNLRHKRLRPSDLSAERRRISALVKSVPYVTSVEVQLLFEDDEMVVDLNIGTDFGPFYTRRAFDAA